MTTGTAGAQAPGKHEGASPCGGCLCGGVRWRVRGALADVVACHCGQCHRTSGHFAAMTHAPLARFDLVEQASLAWYRSSPTVSRGFCRTCGGNLFWREDGADSIYITAGSIDGPSGLTTVAHIFCDAKGDYYDLPTDVPLYPEDL